MDSQQQIFQDLWTKFSSHIREGDGTVDFPGQEELRPRYLTTVVRLPKEASQACFEYWSGKLPDDYHYTPEDMHLTLLNLDPFIGNKSLSNEEKAALARAIEKSVSNLPDLAFKITGFGLFPTTVYAQIYETRNTLELYREAVAAAASEYTHSQVKADALVKGIAFANVVRFKQKPSTVLADFSGKDRTVELGSFKAGSIEVVTTDKLLSPANTITHKIISLD